MADVRYTTILDDFERPAENPLSGGGNWAQVSTGSVGALRLTTLNASPPYFGTASNNPSNAQGIDGSYWTPLVLPDGVTQAEVWGQSVGGGAGAALTGWRLGFFTNPGSANFSGYLYLRASSIGDFFRFRRYTNGSFDIENIYDGESVPGGDNKIYMVRINGSAIEFWASTDFGANFTMYKSVTDTLYRNGLHLALFIEDGTNAGTGWDNFGGGIEDPFIPQFYRRPYD